MPPSTAAKADIEMLTRDLALQAGPFGIRVNCIAPETILTERNMDLLPDSLRQSIVEQVILDVAGGVQ